MIIGIVTEVAIFYFAELDLASGHNVKQLVRAGDQGAEGVQNGSLPYFGYNYFMMLAK